MKYPNFVMLIATEFVSNARGGPFSRLEMPGVGTGCVCSVPRLLVEGDICRRFLVIKLFATCDLPRIFPPHRAKEHRRLTDSVDSAGNMYAGIVTVRVYDSHFRSPNGLRGTQKRICSILPAAPKYLHESQRPFSLPQRVRGGCGHAQSLLTDELGNNQVAGQLDTEWLWDVGKTLEDTHLYFMNPRCWSDEATRRRQPRPTLCLRRRYLYTWFSSAQICLRLLRKGRLKGAQKHVIWSSEKHISLAPETCPSTSTASSLQVGAEHPSHCV